MKGFLSNHPWLVALTITLLGLGLFAWVAADRSESDSGPEAPADDPEPELALPATVRQRVWDIEHLAFLVEAQVFPVWKEAIAQGESKALAELLHPDFKGRVAESSNETLVSTRAISVQRLVDVKSRRREATGAQFLKSLMDLRKHFDAESSGCNVGLGLVRFGPLSKTNLKGPWRGVWKLRLAGESSQGPVELVAMLSLGFDEIDENIGKRKHWIRSASIDRAVITRGPQSLLRDITKTSGIDTRRLHDNWQPKNAKRFRTKTGGVYAVDYDQDGKLDLLIEDIAAGALLYRGLGNGRFEEATAKAGLPTKVPAGGPPWVVSCFADLDNDGDPDLILQDRLYENRGDGTFRDVTKKTNLLLTSAANYAIADFDRDGKVDLYVCHSGKYLPGQSTTDRTPWIDGGLGIDNVLWRNKGNWQFEDVTRSANAGADGIACFAAVWFDANGDLWPDLLAINEFGRNMLLINKSGKFRETTVDPVFGGFSMGVTAGDYNNDGRTDIYVANMYSKAGNRIVSNIDPGHYPPGMYQKLREATTGNKLYAGKGDGTLRVVPGSDHVPDIGWAYGPNFVDLDGDGWLDIYATAGFRSVKRGKPDG